MSNIKQRFIDEVWKPFFELWVKIIIDTETFFTKWDRNESYKEVIWFNVICGLIAGIINTLVTIGSGIYSIVAYPFILICLMFISGAIFFLSFKIFGGGEKLETTIKMVGYTQAVSVFSLGIPVFGLFIWFYQMWILMAAAKIIHELDTRSALLAVAIPVIAIMLISISIMFAVGVGMVANIISHN